MTIFQQIFNKKLPQNALVLPLEYHLLKDIHRCLVFVNVEKELGKGTLKQVDQVLTKEVIGNIPVPSASYRKGQRFVLYRPRKESSSFVNDMISIVKLGQMMLREYNARSNMVCIKGYSFYLTDDESPIEQDYSQLLYTGRLKWSPSPEIFVNFLENFLDKHTSPSLLQQLAKEIRAYNPIIEVPFMIGEILPYAVTESFPRMAPEAVLYNVHQMVYTVAAYASEGIYFRDLQPDNFRLNQRWQVKLIDPSYIAGTIRPDNRMSIFIKQTTPEYLPNVFSQFYRNQQEEKLVRYFGEFTEGVCIGMLERVLRRIFLPRYMGEKYDELYRQHDAHGRIELADKLKFQEDLDFFQDVIEGLPDLRHFYVYQQNLILQMQKEGIFSEKIYLPLSRLLTILRQFSYPVITPASCHSFLGDEKGNPVGISKLVPYLHRLGILSTEEYAEKRSEAEEEMAEDVIFEEEALSEDASEVVDDSPVKPRIRHKIESVKPSKRRTTEITNLNPPAVLSKTNEQVLVEQAILSKFIEENLPNIRLVLHKNPILAQILRKKLSEKLKSKNLQELKAYFLDANDFFQELEANFILERKLKYILSSELCKEIERHVSEKHKPIFRTHSGTQKCLRIIHGYLVAIAKIVFLGMVDLEQDILDILPETHEEVLDFICHYFQVPLEDFSKKVGERLQRM